MLKKRIAMVDFWTISDKDGNPIGHGGKVGNEYYEYIKDEYDVVQYVNNSLIQYIDNPCKLAFSNSLNYGAGKLKRIMYNFKCLSEVYKKEKDSVIWFYVPDIYLFLFILLAAKGKRHVAVNVYEEYIGSKIKHWILKCALKKIDTVFVTNKVLLQITPNGILIPDYAYREEVYGRYVSSNKKEQVVCLGTMNEKKQLVEAVETFTENGYPLYIVGQFSSIEKYEYLCRIKGNNITIENKYISSDEYYQLLASSKFCLVPYDADFYKNRTSGVIQECLFTDTVPISNKDILTFTNIQGIGYESIKELATINLKKIDLQSMQESYKLERDRFYKYDRIKGMIIEALAQT